ncbi:MAG: preprotein translocase subunit SecG [Nitrospirota bacterium]|nr:MAG: preprotein translocase subunit SecG [Nitrospirota bacterium]
MYTLTVVIHLIVCFLMIAAILLQAGKGAEIGAAFGGSSQTVFGSRGPGTFLSKITVGAAVIFMLSSLSLALLSKKETTSSAVIDLHTPAHQESSTTESSTGTSSKPEETQPAEQAAPAEEAQPEAEPAPANP